MKGEFRMRSRGHLGTEAILDYLEDRLEGARRLAFERHLGLPC